MKNGIKKWLKVNQTIHNIMNDEHIMNKAYDQMYTFCFFAF